MHICYQKIDMQTNKNIILKLINSLACLESETRLKVWKGYRFGKSWEYNIL